MMATGLFRDDRGGLWHVRREEHGTFIVPASAPAPSGRAGLSGLGDAASVYFTWRAPTQISLGSFLTDGWNAAQSRLGNKLAERGVRITKITSAAISYFPQLRYALVVNGYAPPGIDGFESLVADYADAEGFRVDRSGIEFRAGGTAKPGDGAGGGDDEEDGDFPSWMIPAVAGILLLGFLRR
jgi:hypothetical protein